ncbi:hypothetical protein [Cohnella endophytica]|uniref:hypothetical protein n=1 Tax=Cohnella endophytica TaxID=2419778 RepID=UPI0011C45AA8|nr:hypothetical protein [Cohnella endophytica]
MRKIVCALMGLMLVAGVFGSSASAGSTASATGELKSEKLAFGYTDASGKRLLGFESVKPGRFTQAIYAPGAILSVKFQKHQKLSSKSTGRQNEWNFERDQGEIYQVVQGKIERNSTVLLAEKDAFIGHEFLKFKPLSKGTFSKNAIGQIEKTKKRKVLHQGLIGQVNHDNQIGIVEYARVKGKKPLASLVMTTPSGPIFEDFEGNDDPQSTWRVSDGGKIEADWFGVLFVTKSKAGYSIGYEWYGDEGSSLKVVQQKGTKFRLVEQGYRYTAGI